MTDSVGPWPILPLGTLAAEMCLGKMLDKDKNRGVLQPYLRNVNVRWLGFDLSDLKEMRFEKGEEERFGVQVGDLVICEGGEPGRAAVWKGLVENARIQKALHRVRFRPNEYDPRFAMYYLYYGCGCDLFSRYFTGSTIKHLTGEALSRVPFPLPPFAEQGRIVCKLDELLSDLDAGVAALERARSNLKKYRAAVLKAAVTGDLTDEWRAAHPDSEQAASLLDRIMTERRQKWEADQQAKFIASGKVPPKGWQDKYSAPPTPEVGTLSPLPPSWKWAAALQICERVESGSTPSADKMTADAGEVPFIKVYNLTADGRLNFSYKPTFVSKETHLGQLARSRVLPGDVLMNIVGPPLGKVSLVPDDYAEWNMNQAVVLFRPLPGLLNRYLLLCLLSEEVLGWITRQAKATAGQFNISVSMSRELPIPMPPAAEQEVIVAEAERQLSAIVATENYITASLKRAGRLRQSILKEAFAGRLVPQDPTDEPASVLLQRIKAARAAAPGTTGRRKRTARVRTSPATPQRREPKGIIFRRGALAAYAVSRLAGKGNLNRTQLAKALYLTQTHVGIDLAMEFKRYPHGPLDETMYKVEGFGRKQGWFTFESRGSGGVSYQVGPGTEDRCGAAVTIAGTRLQELDRLLDKIAGMTTDQVELFATLYAAWNDLLLDGRPATEEAVLDELYGWHESKRKFDRAKALKCFRWMSEQEFVPAGSGIRTQPLPDDHEGETP